ncbi:50S ribosomal protein L24 [Candidatus Woesearchaeota archaeon]|nr:50S ribosomal protein L24 [Candidatus Woesearchaeota archaeon]
MKKDFIATWKSSTQPRKQRKYRYNVPLHTRGGFLDCHLSKELRTKYQTRALRVRKGDKVKVMRGKFKGREEKVERVSTKLTKVFLSKIEQTKKEGSKSLIPFEPSNLLITNLETSDKKRMGKLTKQQKTAKDVKPTKEVKTTKEEKKE